MNYKLSPSDMTFSYDGCKRCFYLKAVKGIVQPSIPIPSVFSKIASLLKNHYAGKQTGELHLALPPGIISHGERNVRSQVIALPNHDATCYINGRFDIVVSFEDGTYGIIDFKTGNPSRESAAFYSRQLHAYAYALEHPASNALALAPVTRLGLLYFYPSGINQQNLERLFYEAEITWIEIEKDEARFLRFIDEMLYLLEMPEAPPHSSNCPWCNYASRLNDF
ncbi:MAG: PD-(D/E)XK nuclease family protein [Dehalococcoidales bacterium]|nr:PD-(D/E)XK nuclease family protein [Dehalococcoidales bacterium]